MIQENQTVYKRPQRRLVRFFEKSRNQWKEKCREAKIALKKLKNRVGYLEASKAELKARVKELENELRELKEAAQARQNEVEELKKTATEEPTIGCMEEFRIAPANHQYSIAHIMLFLSLVLSASTSFRGASRTLGIVLSYFQLPFACPSWFAGRLWLLRLGYYKLTRAKQRAEDWVWIVDHTVQCGEEKCTVILGVRLQAIAALGGSLSHDDVEPIALFPVKQSNGEIVFQQLEETVDKTGVPRAIVSDKGSELRAGVEKFCETHPSTWSIHDIKHKTALVLKHELQEDENWLSFMKLAEQTRVQIQQTSLFFLAPPNQRSKSRYMNVDILVRWGCKMLAYMDNLASAEPESVDPGQVEGKIGWIRGFREQLKEWEDLMEIVSLVEHFVTTQGLYARCHRKLRRQLVGMAPTKRTRRVRAQLVAFVEQESQKAKSDERVVGSSEVIESVLGKLKRLEQDQSRSGFTGLLLGIAAFVSTTTAEVVQEALETVPTKKVLDWRKETLGKSVQAKRKEAFALDH
jgi:hypothetical protein